MDAREGGGGVVVDGLDVGLVDDLGGGGMSFRKMRFRSSDLPASVCTMYDLEAEFPDRIDMIRPVWSHLRDMGSCRRTTSPGCRRGRSFPPWER